MSDTGGGRSLAGAAHTKTPDIADAGPARAEAEPVTHDCPGPECRPYPTFDDDPARWGLRPEPPMTEAELAAAAELEAWGLAGPAASYAEWVAEGQRPEPEAEL